MSPPVDIKALRRRLEECPRLERRSLGRWMTRVDRMARKGRPIDRSFDRIRREIDRAVAARSARVAARSAMRLDYPEELPVSGHREELLEVIRTHQVVVVCGETGSGKTTQLPKICLEAGRGIDGLIGHTQPRRVAAQSVAERLAEETGTELGGLVGWQVRFQKKQCAATCVKVMTDGILLAETPDDPSLDRYDTLIIDEAHERSLNIDFLLGYLRRLLSRRPDLTLIITSATIDAERFSAHFDDCPVVEVSGRSHPVEVEYHPPAALELADEGPVSGAVIEAAIRQLETWDGLQDVLVFLPGEREIRDAITHLEGAIGSRWDCMPLYARLPGAQQRKIFQPGARRRVILATNVAETSLTVPRVTAVIDSGLARISRFSARARLQRLPVEQIAQASARQRAGRCGRIAPGRCIRLYEEAAFEEAPSFTQPEILRSNLASVILRMLGLGLGAIEKFPFLDRPSPRLVEEGWATLHELGAVDRDRVLTEIGQRLVQLPVDPRIGRMLVASIEERVLSQVLVIASALSIQDPRLRPPGHESEADLAQAAWRDEKSDFMGLLRLWIAHQEVHRSEGASAARRWCQSRWLSPARMREWFDVHRQLRETVQEVFEVRARTLKDSSLGEGGWGAMHRAILSGLVSSIGRRNDDRSYDTVRGGQFQIHPASGLVRSEAPWIVVAELLETTRRYGRMAAKIRGDWVERVAPHLVRAEYEEPHYLVESGQVAAYERIHFGQLVVVPRRRVPFGPIDPVVARDIFIQEALVEEKLRTRASFLSHNIGLRRRIEQLEEKGRRHDLLAPSEHRFAFYDRRLPAEIHSAPSFERWRSSVEQRTPSLLMMSDSDLLDSSGQGVDSALYPDTLDPEGADLRLDYRHRPGEDADGVSLEISLAALGQLDVDRIEWMVPGLLEEKVEVLIRSLPKRVRTRFTPIAETARAACEVIDFGVGDLFEMLAAHLSRIAGFTVLVSEFDRERIPEHLAMTVVVTDEVGQEVARGRDPRTLLRHLQPQVDAAFDQQVEGLAEGLWVPGADVLPEVPLPESILVPGVTGRLVGWVALVHELNGMYLQLLSEQGVARQCHHHALTRALVARCGSSMSGHLDWLLEGRGLDLLQAGLGRQGTVRDEIETLLVEAAFLRSVDSWSLRSQSQLEQCLESGFGGISEHAEQVVDAVESILVRASALRIRLEGPHPSSWAPVLDSMHRTLTSLVPASLSTAGWQRVSRAPRLLDVLARRLDRLAEKGVTRELRDLEQLAPWQQRLSQAHRGVPNPEPLQLFEQLLEDFGAHQVAPALAPAGSGSVRRLCAAWNALCAEVPRLDPVR
ncbi:MAG: ATP-dependent RNA helicase HrpA [Planctomycetes bacterium TMED75]|nr:ATP-dependent RNA helicase HrpA [Planctomycetaceae bacterium]OUU94100.1 MAG: ATP-dependent RNA helicase HrpA [Planctomycetes bacterium TMED75]